MGSNYLTCYGDASIPGAMCCLGTGYILDFCTPESAIKGGFAWWRHMPIYPEVCFRCQSKVVVLILLQCNQNRLRRILWDPHLGRKLIKSLRPMAFPSRITCIGPVGMVHWYYPASTYCGSLKIWVTRAEKLGKLLYLAIIWSREELGIVDKFLGAPMVKNTQTKWFLQPAPRCTFCVQT